MFRGQRFAAGSVVYSDEQLGFSIEMPEDFEYYADLVSQLPQEQNESIAKQPMYVGYDANLSITYGEGGDEFAQFAKLLPDGISEQELDFYMLPGKDKDEFMQSIVDGVQELGLETSVISKEWIDYGGKLCAYLMLQGSDEEAGIDYYQGSLSFMYKNYFISLTYTKINSSGNVTQDDAQDEFEECFETLLFDTVPSDKDARIQTGIDWTKVAIWGVSAAVTAGLVWLIMHFIVKKADKKRHSGGMYGNGTDSNDNQNGRI